jgi:tRNA U34 5-methylaminomethyl-2-thiouridine-forming methyltransferase MnmC
MAAPSARTCSSPATACPPLARVSTRFHIAELGFGTGLNFIETWRQWIAVPRHPISSLKFTSFEAYPMAADDMARALERWPELEWAGRSVHRQMAAEPTRISRSSSTTDNPES